MGVALFALHAQGKRRCMKDISSNVDQFLKTAPANLASVAPCKVRAVWLWFQRQMLQAGRCAYTSYPNRGKFFCLLN